MVALSYRKPSGWRSRVAKKRGTAVCLLMETLLIPLTEPGLEPACLISKSFDCSTCLESGPAYCGLLNDKSLLSLLRRRGTPYDSLRFATFARSSAVVQAAEEVLLEEPTLLPAGRISYLVDRLYPWLQVSTFEIGLHLGRQSHRVLPDEVGGSYYLRAAYRRRDRARLKPLPAEGDADIDEAESVLDLVSRDTTLVQAKLSKPEQIDLARTFHASVLADHLKQQYEGAGASPGEAVAHVFRLAAHHGNGQCGSACDLSATIAVVPQADVHEILRHIDLTPPTGGALERWNTLREAGRRANHELVISQLGSIWRHIEHAEAPVGEITDLFQDAVVAVIEAVRAFDPSRGTAFSAFVGWRIRVALQRSSYDKCRQIRLPVHLWERLITEGKVEKRSLIIELEEQLAEARDEIIVGPALVSLEELLDQLPEGDSPEGDEAESTADQLDMASDEPPIDADLIQRSLRDTVERVLGTLSLPEARVITARFGLADGRSKTLEETGRGMGVTRERIRQIEAKAFRKLQHPSRSRVLRDYLE